MNVDIQNDDGEFSLINRRKVNQEELKEIEVILFKLKDHSNVFFKNMNQDMKDMCDRLVQLVINLKDRSRKDLLNLVHQIFDNDDEIYIPGTIGSYIMNCIFNFKNEREIKDLKNYDNCNFLLYHNLPERKLFTPLRYDKKNTKNIILITEKDTDTFKLEDQEKNLLRNMGVDLSEPITLMSYLPSTRTFREITNITIDSGNDEIRSNSFWIFILIVIVILCLLFLFFSFKGKSKRKKQ